MARIVRDLSSNRNAGAFLEPVDWEGLGLTDYLKIIDKPMDLGTIRDKLAKGDYKTAHDCAADIRLVWENCKIYNREGSIYYSLAEGLSNKFEAAFARIPQAELDAVPQVRPGPTMPDKMEFSRLLYKLRLEDLGQIILQLDSYCPAAIERTAEDNVDVNIDAIDSHVFWSVFETVQEMMPADVNQAMGGNAAKKGKRRGSDSKDAKGAQPKKQKQS